MYADIIIDITHENWIKYFSTVSPQSLRGYLKLEQKSSCPLEEEIKRQAAT